MRSRALRFPSGRCDRDRRRRRAPCHLVAPRLRKRGPHVSDEASNVAPDRHTSSGSRSGWQPSLASAASDAALWHGMMTPTTLPGAAIGTAGRRRRNRFRRSIRTANPWAPPMVRCLPATLESVWDCLPWDIVVTASMSAVPSFRGRGTQTGTDVETLTRSNYVTGICGSRSSITRRNASTRAGSNCLPRCRSISAIASLTGQAALEADSASRHRTRRRPRQCVRRAGSRRTSDARIPIAIPSVGG